MQLFPAEILHYAGGIDSFEKKWRCHPSIRNHQVLFSYPSASASHSQPAGHPWLSPWPSLDTPVAQSRSEDSGFGPWHLHSATPSETPQCGDSNSGGERMERMEGGWSMKRLEKDVMRPIGETQKISKTFKLYMCLHKNLPLAPVFREFYIESLWPRHPSCFSNLFYTCYPSIRLVSRACGAERKCSRFSLRYWSCRGTGVVSRQWVTTWHSTFSMRKFGRKGFLLVCLPLVHG